MAAPPPSPPQGYGYGAVAGAPQPGNLWNQNFYRIRKKVLTIGNKYWIEDNSGRILGFSKQKLFKLKEDIRIYADENMTQELFQIKQTQIIDAWGKFMVIDSATNQPLGSFRRKALMSGFIKDEYEVYDAADQMIGKLAEGTGRGLLRKFLPIIPEKVQFELHGRPVAQINQEFKVIGDIWNVDCTNLPNTVDRRCLLAAILLMGMIERDRK